MTEPLTPEEMTAYLAGLKRRPARRKARLEKVYVESPAVSVKQLEAFLAQPGINVRGICTEAGFTQQALYKCLASRKPPGKNMLAKLLPVMRKYGFNP